MLPTLTKKRIPIYLGVLIFFLVLLTLPLLSYFRGKAVVSLILAPAKTTLAPGRPFQIKIILNTGKYQIDGVDAILNYDPTTLTVISLEKGNIPQFKSYPAFEIDAAKGRIYLSVNVGVESPTPVTGLNLVLGTVTFRSRKAVSQTVVSFDFQKGEKNDSNVVEYKKYRDILTQVENGFYTVE